MEAIKPEEKQIINHVLEYAKRLGVEIKTAVFNGKSYVFTGPIEEEKK